MPVSNMFSLVLEKNLNSPGWCITVLRCRRVGRWLHWRVSKLRTAGGFPYDAEYVEEVKRFLSLENMLIQNWEEKDH